MQSFLECTFYIERVVLACYVAYGKGEPVHKNRPSHGLVLIDGARHFIFDDGREFMTKRNDLVYLPKGCSYVVHSCEAGGCYAINFQLLNEAPDPVPFVFPTKHSEKFRENFRVSESAWKSKKTFGYERCAQMLYAIIYDLKQEMNAEYMPKSKTVQIEPALSYISEHYTFENISVAHLAELCRISEVYLRRIFHSTFGMSPLQYINHMKLSRARELIRSGECSVSEAASMSGFFDDSYFSREFKKAFGVRPKELLPKE